MLVFNHKNAISSTEFKGFEGICATAPHKHVPSADDIVNFRVLGDGSLLKRCGFSHIANCDGKIRTVWSGNLEGEQVTLIVYGIYVVKVNIADKTLVPLGRLGIPGGNIKFIYFKSQLYIMDEWSFYKVTKEGVEYLSAYAPLYGKLWGVAQKGKVYEPLNLATRHIRMSYRVDQELIYLCVDHLISSIDAVYIDGQKVTDSGRYYFNRSLMCVCVMGLELGQIVDLYLTVDESELDILRLRSCKQSAILGGYTDTKLFFWDGLYDGCIYSSREVDAVALISSSYVYGEALPLYFPADSIISTEGEKRKITALCRHYDRLLLFTDENTWMIDDTLESTNILSGAIMINSSHGCTSAGAAITCGNDPICVGDGAILKWTAETDDLNECNVYSISSQIEPFLKPSFFKNAKILLNKKHSELLFYEPSDEDGLVWIYNYKTENWYKFDGIGANEFFLCEDMLGFIKGTSIYLFDETLNHDIDSEGNEREIIATFESHPIDLDVYANKKRLAGMSMSASFKGGSICAEYLSDSNSQRIASVTIKDESTYPTNYIKRLNSQRFSYLTLRLTAKGDASSRIYSTNIFTKL